MQPKTPGVVLRKLTDIMAPTKITSEKDVPRRFAEWEVQRHTDYQQELNPHMAVAIMANMLPEGLKESTYNWGTGEAIDPRTF